MLADLVPPPTASPVPWGMWCVIVPGVFSALVWGLGTLFRPRPTFARAPEAPPGSDSSSADDG